MRLPAHNAQDTAGVVPGEVVASSPSPTDETDAGSADATPAAADAAESPALATHSSEAALLCAEAELHYKAGDFRAARRQLSQAQAKSKATDLDDHALAQRMATLRRQLAPDPAALIVGGLTLLLATLISWLALTH